MEMRNFRIRPLVYCIPLTKGDYLTGIFEDHFQ